MKKYVALFDTHIGFERRGGHKVPLHDPKALAAVLAFIRDFTPDVVILGGDILDCGAISHHNHGKPGRVEGLRLLSDAQFCKEELIQPIQDVLGEKGEGVFIVGNHEDWIEQLVEEEPGLEGILSLRPLLSLDQRWKVVERGGHFNLGKLTFIHGDQLTSAEFCAKNAVITYERSIRFGHFHTHQVYTKSTPIDQNVGRTGVAVPCLCRKDPSYGNGKPNKWVQGFNYGYLLPSGNFNDYTPIIVDGKFVAEGKVYGGKA